MIYLKVLLSKCHSSLLESTLREFGTLEYVYMEKNFIMEEVFLMIKLEEHLSEIQPNKLH